jgi:hypothetical protein
MILMVTRGIVDGSSYPNLLFSEELIEEEITKHFMTDSFKVKPSASVVKQSHRLGRFSSTVSETLVHSLVVF